MAQQLADLETDLGKNLTMHIYFLDISFLAEHWLTNSRDTQNLEALYTFTFVKDEASNKNLGLRLLPKYQLVSF